MPTERSVGSKNILIMVKHVKTATSNIIDNPALPYLTIKPNTKEDWLNERKNGIGASECGKIMGVSKYGQHSLCSATRPVSILR